MEMEKFAQGTVVIYRSRVSKERAQEAGVISTRPVVIVSARRSQIGTCYIVMPCTTSNGYFGFYLDTANSTSRYRDKCVIVPTGIHAIQPKDIENGKILGFVPHDLMKKCINALMWHLGMSDEIPEYLTDNPGPDAFVPSAPVIDNTDMAPFIPMSIFSDTETGSTITAPVQKEHRVTGPKFPAPQKLPKSKNHYYNYHFSGRFPIPAPQYQILPTVTEENAKRILTNMRRTNSALERVLASYMYVDAPAGGTRQMMSANLVKLTDDDQFALYVRRTSMKEFAKEHDLSSRAVYLAAEIIAYDIEMARISAVHGISNAPNLNVGVNGYLKNSGSPFIFRVFRESDLEMMKMSKAFYKDMLKDNGILYERTVMYLLEREEKE